MNPCELTASITAFANLLANQLTDGDLELAAALFTQLGDTLATIAVQRAQSRLSCNQQKKFKGKIHKAFEVCLWKTVHCRKTV